MNRAVVNLATEPARERYLLGQARLGKSLDAVGYEDMRVFWANEYPIGCPTHKQVMRGFKPYVMWDAVRSGADIVLWCDASIVVRKSLDPIFETIERDGYYFNANPGQSQAYWGTDYQLKKLGVTRTEAEGFDQCSSAVVGINAKSVIGLEILTYALGYLFDPGVYGVGAGESDSPLFKGIRTDQTVFSCLIHKWGLKMQPQGWFRFTQDLHGLDDTIVEARGIR